MTLLQLPTEEREEEEYQRLCMSYEEFLEWADEDTHAEWAEGEVIVHVPTKDRHQRIAEFVERLLALFVELFDLGLVRIPPFEVKLWPDGPAREPDVFFLAKEHADALSDDRLAGPPDLVVEVISPGSVRLDRHQKFREYEAAGVPEYWIFDSRPSHQRADFYYLDDSGRYELFATEDDEIVYSKVIANFWLRPAWLWQEPMPTPLLALMEIVGPKNLVETLENVSAEADGE
jgi:Uma2 family endonuclease